jgi:hypothetical protein
MRRKGLRNGVLAQRTGGERYISSSHNDRHWNQRGQPGRDSALIAASTFELPSRVTRGSLEGSQVECFASQTDGLWSEATVSFLPAYLTVHTRHDLARRGESTLDQSIS